MRTSRFTDEQIIAIVREYEAGAKLAELCRKHGVSPATFFTSGERSTAGWRSPTPSGSERSRRRTAASSSSWPTPCSTIRRSRVCWQKTGEACSAASGGGDGPRGARAVAAPRLQADRDLALGGGTRAQA